MKKLTCLSLLLLLHLPVVVHAQALDTLVDVGGYKLHFHIVKGKGTPILFDAGGGDDASVWNNLLPQVSRVTGATLITYDRAGFGKSTLDTAKTGLQNGVLGLEAGLRKLHYDGKLLLVAHSQGNFYATVFAYRHPDKVAAAVLIDGSTSCWFMSRLEKLQRQNEADMAKFKKTNPGVFYQAADLSRNVLLLDKSPFPVTVPLIDLVSGNPPFNDAEETADWRRCHQEFAAGAGNRQSLTAFGCGHYIYRDNPALVVNSIVQMYAGTLGPAAKAQLMARALAYNIAAHNETKKAASLNRYSESDLNSWGYALIKQGKIKEALAVFKLNTVLYPTSSNAFDSYGEALLKNGDKEESAKMYQRSLELKPGK